MSPDFKTVIFKETLRQFPHSSRGAIHWFESMARDEKYLHQAMTIACSPTMRAIHVRLAAWSDFDLAAIIADNQLSWRNGWKAMIQYF